MTIENLGGAGGLTDAQLNVIKEKFGEAKAEKLITLFESGEDKGEAGLYDDIEAMGFERADLEALAEADPAFKAILEGTAADDTAKPAAKDKPEAKADGDVILDKGEVSALEDEVKALKAEIEGLDAEIDSSKTKLEAKEAELEAKRAELDSAKETYEAEKAEQERLLKLYDDNKEQYDKIKDDIENATKSLEDDMKEKQQTAIYKAMSEYDPDKDGSWENFLNKKLEGVMESSALSGLIESLSSKETSVLQTLGNLQLKITAQNGIVAAAKANVDTVQAQFDTLDAEVSTIKDDLAAKETARGTASTALDTKTASLEAAKAKITAAAAPTAAPETSALGGGKTGSVDKSTKIPAAKDAVESKKTPDEIKALVPKEELAFVCEHDLDLTEKLDDGSPRYVFAKGAMDNTYHIYDMADVPPDSSAGQDFHRCLPRIYGKKTGSWLGEDIVQGGNGYINGLAGEGINPAYQQGSGELYFLGECGKAMEFQTCYGTESPLSLDLNGDGVKTSDKVVDFDIDGDGVVDKINDSADGVLVFDTDGDGISGEDGTECFGNNTDIDGDGKKDGYKDGFEALKAFARDKGLINDADDMVLDADDIKYLEENFGFGIKAGGYTSDTQSLTELGITEINLAKTNETTLEDDFDGKGNQLMKQEGATFVQNGETKEYADIWHKKQDAAETAKADKADKAEIKSENTVNSGLSFDISSTFNDVNYFDILNEKLEDDSYKKQNKFNIFDVNVDKPKENEDKKEKKIDEK